MNFGEAIQTLKSGGRVSRAGWNGKGMWLALQVPDAHSKMQRPYIYMSDAEGKLVPWLASQTDILAEDWGQMERLITDDAICAKCGNAIMASTVWCESIPLPEGSTCTEVASYHYDCLPRPE